MTEPAATKGKQGMSKTTNPVGTVGAFGATGNVEADYTRVIVPTEYQTRNIP